ncbi:hypothetical protein [Streptomyces sp. NPDC004721]
MADTTAYVEVLARLLCAADVHVHDGDHPSWQQLRVARHGRGQDDYRKAARWLAARLTVADKPATVQQPPADQAAVYAEVADRLAADAEQGDKEGLTRIYRRSAAKQVRDWANELRRMADEAQQPESSTLDEAALARDRTQLLEAMSGVSEERWCAGWMESLDQRLHAEAGIWETIGRTIGWPTGNYDHWVWMSWDEAARLYSSKES